MSTYVWTPPDHDFESMSIGVEGAAGDGNGAQDCRRRACTSTIVETTSATPVEAAATQQTVTLTTTESATTNPSLQLVSETSVSAVSATAEPGAQLNNSNSALDTYNPKVVVPIVATILTSIVVAICVLVWWRRRKYIQQLNSRPRSWVNRPDGWTADEERAIAEQPQLLADVTVARMKSTSTGKSSGSRTTRSRSVTRHTSDGSRRSEKSRERRGHRDGHRDGHRRGREHGGHGLEREQSRKGTRARSSSRRRERARESIPPEVPEKS